MYRVLLTMLLIMPAISWAQDFSLEYNGMEDYVYITNSSLVSSDKLTVMYWCKPANFGSEGMAVVATGNQNDYQISIDSFGRPLFGIYTENEYHELISTTVLELYVWQHLTGIYDGTSMKIYIDGVLDAEGPASGGIGSTQVDNLTFGVYWYGGPHHGYYNGFLDDVAIWERVLDEEEVQVAMQSPSLVSEDDWRGYWDFNEGIGSTTADQSGNGLTGTIYGATWNEDTPIGVEWKTWGGVKSLFK